MCKCACNNFEIRNLIYGENQFTIELCSKLLLLLLLVLLSLALQNKNIYMYLQKNLHD